MRLMLGAFIIGLAVMLTADARSETVLKENLEEQGKWKKNIRGDGDIELVPDGVEGKCLKVTSKDRALVYYSMDLDPKRVLGKRLIVRAKVKLDNVEQGEQVYATAKIHVGVMIGKRMTHHARRFTGTADWHDEVLIAEVPENADRVVLDLGIQNGTGTAYYDNLTVDDGVKQHEIVNIASAANASCKQVGLDGVPVADVRLAGVDFFLLPGSTNFGRTCVALRGEKRPDLPGRILTVIPVDRKATRLFFLQAAAGDAPKPGRPCLIYTIHYDDGEKLEAVMREGRNIGSLESPSDLPDWKVAWTSRTGGRTIGLGVTEWKNPRPDVAIKFIRLSTPGTGAVPVVAAISLDPVKE